MAFEPYTAWKISKTKMWFNFDQLADWSTEAFTLSEIVYKCRRVHINVLFSVLM